MSPACCAVSLEAGIVEGCGAALRCWCLLGPKSHVGGLFWWETSQVLMHEGGCFA